MGWVEGREEEEEGLVTKGKGKKERRS